jgi:hypothetical protein
MTMITHFDAENASKFTCEQCDFKCSKLSNYKKHLSTRKHIKRYIGLQDLEEKKLKRCACGKEYVYRQGLYAHKKNCDYKPGAAAAAAAEAKTEAEPEPKPKLYEKEDIVDVLLKENQDFKNIILELVKNNGDLQKQMLDICKNSVGATNNLYNNHSHNKTFNLQFFLNEQCKDAMNLMDFVDSMSLELSDLEDVGKLGYVEGISGIIIRKLNELDIYKRPIHCSDAKREIVYVKDDNIWEKENETYDKIRKAVKRVTYKNSALLVPWSQKYPNCMNNQHQHNEMYIKLMGQAMGGKGEFIHSENKIMKKIANAVLIK